MKEKQQTSCQIFIAHHMRQNSAGSYQNRRKPGWFRKGRSNSAVETEKQLRKDRPGRTYCVWITLAQAGNWAQQDAWAGAGRGAGG